MDSREELVKKLHGTVSLMGCEARMTRSYGTAHELTSSDMDFLKCVERKAQAKAGDISQFLGVTGGATTQLARKLEQKGYVEPYRMEGNRKEVYYRLTAEGETACRGFDAHYDRIRRKVEGYVAGLDEAAVEQIEGLLDTVVSALEVGSHCSVKHGEQTSEYPLAAGEKKCEKCQKIY